MYQNLPSIKTNICLHSIPTPPMCMVTPTQPTCTHSHNREITTFGTARQMNRLDSQASCNTAWLSGPQTAAKYYHSKCRVSSPLTKLSMSSNSSSNNFLEENTLLTGSSPTVFNIEQKLLQGSTRQWESETSIDSLMESDVSSLEESLELCESSKDCESNMTSTIS